MEKKTKMIEPVFILGLYTQRTTQRGTADERKTTMDVGCIYKNGAKSPE